MRSAFKVRYSRIDRQMWGDQQFLELSRPDKPNAQDLWIYLLTGPQNTNIPGLMKLRVEALAREFEWPLEGTRRCLDEIVSLGMAEYDDARGLLWLPKALRHNPPGSPNVVVGWRVTWAELPECDLRSKAQKAISRELSEMGEAYVKAFEICVGRRPPNPSTNPSGKASADQSQKPPPKPSVKASAEASPRPLPNQEQEQEQEQDSPPSPPSRLIVALISSRGLNSRHLRLHSAQSELYFPE